MSQSPYAYCESSGKDTTNLTSRQQEHRVDNTKSKIPLPTLIPNNAHQ